MSVPMITMLFVGVAAFVALIGLFATSAVRNQAMAERMAKTEENLRNLYNRFEEDHVEGRVWRGKMEDAMIQQVQTLTAIATKLEVHR